MLLCLTANHRNASFDLLEKLSIGAPRAASALVEGSDFVSGAVVVATCNRFEAYLDIDEPLTAASAVAVEATVDAMSSASGVTADALRESVTVLTGDDVVGHLFAVSSGLESVVVGEGEISGQVRRALEQAREAGTTSSGLEQLFQKASTTSRTVRTTTAVGTAGRSLVRLALELASSRIRDWSTARVLMIGTGAYAGASLAALRDRGATDVEVFSPSGRAEKFALSRGARPSTDLAASLAEADVVVTCTTVEGHVLTPALFTADTFGSGRSTLLIDLGLPRNIDPAVASIDGIELLDLETISLHAPLEELNATRDARSAVRKAAAEFSAAEAEQALAPAVVAMRTHVFGILDAEIARARSRGDSSPQTEQALRHLASVLLHTPSVRARELARAGDGDQFVAGLNALFGIAPSAPVASIDGSTALDAGDDDQAATA
ncbi:glutamyl-tRNA reductase [Marisediminicola senii]|uniref:glutamyl-tRNA reductase n=1 Tax=Marisediminicola senii TaxID=2711233 RepID=UPI0013EE0D5C|nr:glutamyl-tRNA reductase [Marisediminicola senii]